MSTGQNIFVVNGDDFGFTHGTNKGIIKSYREGILTSASAIVTTTGFDEAVRLAKEEVGLDVGLHLTLTDTKPVNKPENVSSLINPKTGLFYGHRRFFVNVIKGCFKRKDIYNECKAQIEKARDSGLKVNRIDSHKGVHFYPMVFAVLADLGEKYNISYVRDPNRKISLWPVPFKSFIGRNKSWLFFQINRYRTKDVKWKSLPYMFEMKGRTFEEKLQSIFKLTSIRFDKPVELLCHPASRDSELERLLSTTIRQRSLELQILCHKKTKELFNNRVKLANFKELV